MTYNLPLDKMTIEDKLQTMESLWEDLCKTADSLASPDWHRDILKVRELDLKNGNDEFVEWETAKKEINNNLK